MCIRDRAVTVQTGGEIKTLNGLDYYSYSSGATIMTLTSDSAQDELKNAQNTVVTARNGVTNAQKQVQAKQERITELKKLIADSTIDVYKRQASTCPCPTATTADTRSWRWMYAPSAAAAT